MIKFTQIQMNIRGVVFDMDGVLRIGSKPIDGVNDTFEFLRKRGIKYMISTNECRYTPDELRDELQEMGIEISEDVLIYTAGLSARDYLQSKIDRFPNETFSFGVVGGSGLYRVLNQLTENEGCSMVDLPPKYQTRLYLVIGSVDKIKISSLEKIRQWIQAGAKIITTCCDMSDPSSKGDFCLGMPSHMLHMVSYNTAVHHSKSYSTGKPHPMHRKNILNHLKCDPSEILFVGDTLYTDIKLAEESGFKSALVLTGNTKKDGYNNNNSVIESDYVIDSIRDLPSIF